MPSLRRRGYRGGRVGLHVKSRKIFLHPVSLWVDGLEVIAYYYMVDNNIIIACYYMVLIMVDNNILIAYYYMVLIMVDNNILA